MASEQMDVDGGEDRTTRGTSVISIDDLEAAQALEGLRSDTTQSPPQLSAASDEPPQPEPLLSLLTSTHPILSSAINGSVSMYTSSKSYSPRFRYGAEFLERNIGSPVVNTVGTVGRKTGVEGGLRWALQQRREPTRAGASTTNNESSTPPAPAAEQQDDAMDIEKGRPSITRRSSGFSTETLPPYDPLSSPAYEESTAMLDSKREPGAERTSGPASTWKGRLVISTSGLGVAMSEESLRSLTYCLTWLRWANTRLGNAVIALKRVLQEWESSREGSAEPGTEIRPRSPTVVAQQIQQLRGDVLQTLKQVVDIVSKYAGGALPENARNLVRRHLTSLPRRFRIAATSTQPPSDSATPQSDVTTNARRALVLAEEGLDMMAQVSGIVNDTLVSAEEWCDRLRRPKPSINAAPTGAQEGMPPQQLPPMDVKLPIPQQQDDVEMTEGS